MRQNVHEGWSIGLFWNMYYKLSIIAALLDNFFKNERESVHKTSSLELFPKNEYETVHKGQSIRQFFNKGAPFCP